MCILPVFLIVIAHFALERGISDVPACVGGFLSKKMNTEWSWVDGSNDWMRYIATNSYISVCVMQFVVQVVVDCSPFSRIRSSLYSFDPCSFFHLCYLCCFNSSAFISAFFTVFIFISCCPSHKQMFPKQPASAQGQARENKTRRGRLNAGFVPRQRENSMLFNSFFRSLVKKAEWHKSRTHIHSWTLYTFSLCLFGDGNSTAPKSVETIIFSNFNC